MGKYNHNSQSVTVFHSFPSLEKDVTLAGYAALIVEHTLSVPLPDYTCARLVLGTEGRKKGCWHLFTPRHKPDDSLQGHLTFALKYEGVDLAVLKALFESVEPWKITDLVKAKPTGAYSRRIWFLYEWLCQTRLDLEDATRGNFIPLVNEALQYPGPPRDSRRHRVRNNLPGTHDFCPLIRRT